MTNPQQLRAIVAAWWEDTFVNDYVIDRGGNYRSAEDCIEDIVVRARAALADGPAMPEGIERDAARYRWIKAAPRLRIDRMPDSHFWISTETGEKYLVSHSLSAFNTGFSGLPTLDDLVDQAMNMYPIALADEPAVPEGREPAAVTGRPSDEELRDLWSWAAGQDQGPWPTQQHCFARAVLARWGNPAPTPPADGEVAELAAWLEEGAGQYTCIGFEDLAAKCARAAELLQQQVLVPVSVSERLPSPEDCDAEGRCWWWYPPVPEQTYGYWAHEDDAIPERSIDEQPTHWLPAHALPLPEVGE